jgi:hypothetical protein
MAVKSLQRLQRYKIYCLQRLQNIAFFTTIKTTTVGSVYTACRLPLG